MEKGTLPKLNLITIHMPDNEPMSLEVCFFRLLESLDLSYFLCGRAFIQSLCEIAVELHKDPTNGINANELLQKKYFLPNLPYIITPDGIQNLLFTNKALRLLSVFIFCESHPYFILPPRVISGQDPRSLQYRIVETFLFANQILFYLHQDINDISNYYFGHNIFKTPRHIILRSRVLYNTEYFNEKLQQYIFMSSHQLNAVLYLIYVHVYMNSPARMEPDTNFDKFFENNVIMQLKTLLDSLSKELKNESISYQELEKNLRDYYILDKLHNPLHRGKPLIKFGNRFVCMRPDQLVDEFDTFLYFKILNNLDEKEKVEFFYQFGIALERHLDIISKRTFGDSSIKPLKKNESDSCADQIIISNPIVHVLIEIKSARADDKVKCGSKKDLENKFVTIFKSSTNKQRGVVQLFKATKKYREDSCFNGTIYTIIVYYGDFPEIPIFDELIENDITSRLDCQGYLEDIRNKPTIWLNLSHLETIFSIIKQGGSFEELLKKLSETTPSKAAEIIINYAKENKLTTCVRPLFDAEMEALQSECTALYKQ